MRPNILFIMTDEHRFDCLGANGNPHIKTPHLDRLAIQGINLQSHTCSSAICTPARVSLITGQYPRRHQAWHVGYRFDPELPNIAHWLNDAGYLTGMFGKCHWEPELNGNAESVPVDEPYYGFQKHAITEDRPHGRYERWLKEKHPEHYEHLWKNTTHEECRVPANGYGKEGFLNATQVSQLPAELHQTPWIADHCSQFIQEAAASNQPWFGLCSFVDPHHAWSAPQEYLDLYPLDEIPLPPRKDGDPGPLHPTFDYNYPGPLNDDEMRRMIRSYYGMITMIDDAVGKLIEQLEATGQLENTIILFTSDHGDYNGDRGLVRKDCMLTDALLRIPMLMHVPGSARSGQIIHSPTQHEDLLPTLFDLINLDIPSSVQGQSFAKALMQNDEPMPRRYSYFEQMKSPDEGHVSFGISDGQWKYSRLWNAEERLIDLRTDLLEYSNEISNPEHQHQLQELKVALLDWMTTENAGFPPKLEKW